MARQSGLGRGLGALLPTSESSSGDGTPVSGSRLVQIPVSDVRPNTYQPRTVFDDEGIASLAASIKELGVLQPILVRATTDGYELIAGERRWRAAKRAGLQDIPAVVKDASDHQSLEQALVENLHRSDLNALEEAAAYQQLIDDFEFTHEQVADRVGKSRAAVSNTLRLMQLSPSIQRLLLDGKLSAGHGRALLGTTDKAFQEALSRRIVNEELSVRATEEAVKLRTRPAESAVAGSDPKRSTAGAPVRPAGILELEDVLSGILDTSVRIDMQPNKKGRLVIDVADVNDLERIFRLLTVGTAS